MRAPCVLNVGDLDGARLAVAECGVDPKEVPRLEAERQTSQGGGACLA